MGNCLVTKLKGVVNNDNLPYLNELCFDVLPPAEAMPISLMVSVPANGTQRVFLTGDQNSYLIVNNQNVGMDYTIINSLPVENIIEIFVQKGSGATKFHIENAYEQLINFKYTTDIISNALALSRPETIKYCKNLNVLRLNGNQGIQGNLLEMFSCNRLCAILDVHDYTSRLTGDCSLIPDTCYLLDFAGLGYDGTHEYHHLSWKNTRPNSANIITMEGLDFGDDLDAMLINQASCVKPTYDIVQYYAIIVQGNRTSASDAAVATLKSMGYIININGVEL